MITRHLTDGEIEQYCLDESQCEPAIVEHAALCAECGLNIEVYQALMTGLRHQPDPVFDFDLSALVLAQLPPPRKRIASDNLLYYLLLVAGIAVSGGGLYYFRGYISGIFAGITWLGTGLIVTTMVCLLSALSLDMYKQYQKKIAAIDLY